MRIIKKHEDRRNEILDVAEHLFYKKGYERCTVNDILHEIGIAKGTFYYYFKSKEEVMDAIIERYIEVVSFKVENTMNNESLSSIEKLMSAFSAMRIEDKVNIDKLDELHKVENVLLHQKILKRIIEYMAPMLANIIEDGVQKKEWSCRYPLQYMQIFLAAALALTDEGIFEVDDEAQLKIMTALISMLEKMLNVPEDSFLKLYLGSL